MAIIRSVTATVGILLLGAASLHAQQVHDSAPGLAGVKSVPPSPPWRDSVRYGGGPSVGAPPSNYTGSAPPSQWCLQALGRAPGDFGVSGESWDSASRSWLRQILSDSTEWGAGWRRVLGGAPQLAPGDSIVLVTDERRCRSIARVINRDLLGWDVGPPPVVVFRIRDYLIAYPSNAQLGEFGMAVGMTLRHRIRGVATW